jgi:multidrug efflux system outer membrane protein
MSRRPLWLTLVLSTALAGCNLAPKYVRPVPPVPAELPQGGIYPAAASDAPDITQVGWRDFFTDPRLVAVIDKGLENNRDLRAAAARVMQARAQFSVRRADRIPSLNASGSATFSNSSGAGGAGSAGGTGGATGVSPDQSIFSLSAGFSSFELDLFGRVANLSRAAQEQYFATQEAQRATRISLIAEIATAWLQMAADQDQLRISQATLATYDKTMQLSQARFKIGISSELEARQAETGFQGARADIAALQTRIAKDRIALDLLVGAPSPADLLPAGLGDARYTRDALTPNLSSEILLRRPDVLQAEHQLIAENANIGAARAAFFPKISLTGLLGTLSTALGGLFAGGSFTYSAGPSLSLPLFDGGRNKGNLDYARASQQLAVANYEKAIQTAFSEVADALAQRGTIDEQFAAQAARANAARIASRLSDARFRAGVDSYLVALDAQRSAYASEQQLVTTRQARALSLIDLYRRLGGGLDPVP